MDRIARALASLHPLADFVCLQEVETRSLRSHLAHRSESGETQLERFMHALREALGPSHAATYDAYYFPAHTYAVAKGAHIYTTGLAILAHRDFTVDHHNAARPHDITHRGINALRNLKQTRICAHVRFCWKGRREESVDVFNTHLSLPGSMSREFWTSSVRMGYGKNQLEEVRKVVRFVESERASDRFVLVGDFNALPGSPVYKHLVDEAGYADPFARMHRLSTEELRSWPTAGFLRLRMHLDHLLSGPGLEWVDFDETHPYGDRTSRFCGLSDHMPLVGRCRVAG
jgi:endonuclease/exonuclease/phosphatase family metal-dependent hydrolase